MKIAHFSDTHTRHDKEKIEESDLFIHTGDFCLIDFKVPDFANKSRSLTYKQAIEFIKWVENYPAKKKIITSGNHEAFLNDLNLRNEFEELLLEKDIIFKDDISEIIEVEGLKIGGAGTYPHIANYMTGKNSYYIFEGDCYFDQVPEDKIDIYLSHAMPNLTGNQWECDALLRFIKERINPIPLFLCCHIHESWGVYELDKSIILNSSCKGQYYNFK